MFNSLDQVLDDCRARLDQAPKNRKSSMQTPVVVTADVDARVMVLRGFDASRWTLRLHTDARAPKVNVIAAHPRVAVLFYDPTAKLQIRARGMAAIDTTGEAVDRAWLASANLARRCYLGAGPGEGAGAPTSGLPAEMEGVEPTDAQLVPARANFAILTIALTDLDWLYLAHTGHVRAQFTRSDCGQDWNGRWVTP